MGWPGSSVEDTTPAGLFSIRYTGPPDPAGVPSTVTAAPSSTLASGARHTWPSTAARPARISSRASFRLHFPVPASRLSSRSIRSPILFPDRSAIISQPPVTYP